MTKTHRRSNRWPARATLLVLTTILCAPMLLATPAKIVRHPEKGVANEYMVVLANQQLPSNAVAGVAQSIAAAYQVEIVTLWEYSLRGFLARAPEQNIEAMAGDPRIQFVEQNFRTDAPKPEMSATQWTWFNNEYLWHLDRVDEVSGAQCDSQHNMCTEGRSVVAYVIDTGVQTNHTQFETPTRVVAAIDFSVDRTNQSAVFTNDVTNGCTAPGYVNQHLWHGTAVASVLAGTQVGVAKTRVVSLKVARCASGEILADDLIDATNWIAAPTTINPYRNDPGVINHSGYVPLWVDDPIPAGSDFSAYSQSVENLTVATNMPFFTSADNFSADACLFSPNDRGRTATRAGSVMVVGGTSMDGAGTDFRYQNWLNGNMAVGRDSGSNAGACVGIYAPAVSIYAARHAAYLPGVQPQVEYDRASGTSFSSPIVAGIAARYMEQQRNQFGVTPGRDAVYTWLLNNAAATINNVTTPQYWFCPTTSSFVPDATYTANPPTNCPTGTLGQTGPGTAPYYFPSVGNTSGARMVYWDQGVCQ